MSISVWPHRQQPIRLPHPWDSPGKNTGVGCHFLLQCMKVKSDIEIALSNPMEYSLPGSSVHGILQARVLESGAVAFSTGPITSWQIEVEKVEAVTDFLFLGSKITADGWWLQPWNQKTTASWQESSDKHRQCAEKQIHHFADKGPYCQGYGLLSVTYGCESRTEKKA